MGKRTYQKGVPVKLSANFTSTEFDCHGGGCCGQTVIDDQLVLYLQMIRDHFGVPITITSGYRCPIHNRNIGSGTGSQHAKGGACDIVVAGVLPREVAKYAESIGILGIGLYETDFDGHFVHIDVRTVKFFWYGQAQQKRTTFGGNVQNTTASNIVVSDPTITILSRGLKGEEVRELQENLIYLGYSCGPLGADGSFGVRTEAAVRLFQKEYGGIGVDGIVGYGTLTAITEAAKANAYRVRVIASVLNVRSGSGMNYSIVSTVRRNAQALILEDKDGWGRLHSPNGWISLQYAERIK